MVFQEKDFIISANYKKPATELVLQQEAPSNIALVKYWGKYPVQLPMNPSISFSLNKSKTITTVKLIPLKKPAIQMDFQFYFEGIRKPDFEPKIAAFFKRIEKYVPYIHYFHWKIDSRNTFPHSSGIASSASAFAALAKLVVELEKILFPEQRNEKLLAKTSFLARLGSGSASRSIEHPVMIWGQHPQIAGTSDLYAIKPDFILHPNFQHYKDTIVLVEKGQKKVSSTAGHSLMNNHIYKEQRIKTAFDNTQKMYQILQSGDLEAFIRITEEEALGLHALMMTSRPNYLLMMPETLRILHLIREVRKTENIPVCFTLDAGANVHILYSGKYQKALETLLFAQINMDKIFDEV